MKHLKLFSYLGKGKYKRLNYNQFNKQSMDTIGYVLVLGQTIKKIRESEKISMAELERLADISKGYVSRIERGTYTSPSITHVAKIAHALDLTFLELLEQANLNI